MHEYRIEKHYFLDGEWYADIWLFHNGVLISLANKIRRNEDGSVSTEYGNELDINWIFPQFIYNENDVLVST